MYCSFRNGAKETDLIKSPQAPLTQLALYSGCMNDKLGIDEAAGGYFDHFLMNYCKMTMIEQFWA